MALVVVRHAESVENADKYNGFYQDRRPYSGQAAHEISRNVVGLTPRGFRQAQWLARELADVAGTGQARVATSTYRRAIDTAAVAFPDMDGRVERSELLDEQHYGDATYMTKAELFATYPDGADDRRLRKHLWVPPGGGESLADGVLQRARAFLAGACDEAGDRSVVAVTHHTTILALRSLLEGRALTEVVEEARQLKTPNAGVYHYEPAGGGRWGRTRAVAPPPM